MRSQRISFLEDILERALSNEHQLMIANEYYSANDLPITYNNDEYGLAELCIGMSVDEILRASSYGKYSYTEPYVFINAHGNLETTDEVSNDWKAIAEWMFDGGCKNLLQNPKKFAILYLLEKITQMPTSISYLYNSYTSFFVTNLQQLPNFSLTF